MRNEILIFEHANNLLKKTVSDGLPVGAYNEAVKQAAYEAGIRIPKDVSLMGFDNISFSALPEIDLTTINQPTQQIATSAVDMLLDHIRDPEAERTNLILPPSLIERKSCRSVRA